MKRRDFLRLGSAGLAAAPLIGGTSTLSFIRPNAVGAQDGSLRKGFMLGTFRSETDREYSIGERFEILSRAGFEGVEPGSGLDRSEVLEAAEAAGLEIPSVVVSTHWQHPLSDPDPAVRAQGRDGLETALEDAAAYGSTSVLLVPGVVNANVSYDEVYERSQEEIRHFVPMAADLGVTIAIENVWNHFLLSPLEAARYVDEFESERVGWHFDVGNILNYGWPEQWIRVLGDRIVMVHIKEFSREKRDDEGLWNGFQVELMDGDNNWPEIMQAFRDVDYSGWGIVEPPYRSPGLNDEEWFGEYLAGRMDQIFAM